MSIQTGERTFAFIDGPNLHATVRALGFEIDYRKLLEYLRKQGHFIRVLYYTAIVEDQEFSTFRPLADWLDYNGYTMVTKPARGFTDSTGRRRFRTSMDVELAVDAMRLADKAEHVILFSGEQSFASLVAALQQMGKRVTVISTIETQPAMVADELRRQADQFIDIDSLQPLIARVGRPPRPPIHEREERFHRQADDDRSPASAERVDEGATDDGVDEDPAPTAGMMAGAEAQSRVSETVGENAGESGEASGPGAAVVVKTVRRRRTTAT
ncbi:MAG: NYN domain-containing protein [Hyphomicrobiaceae bacterium]|nr:NYN domain-containing protein [Hyphomicrobiaceae bacterium]